MTEIIEKKLSTEEKATLLTVLENRFHEHMYRHENIAWQEIEAKLDDEKLLAIYWMEETGGEPDVVVLDGTPTYVDCAKETPEGRRSVCYDDEALQKRKKFKPENSAQHMASQMGVTLLTEAQYKQLQDIEKVDLKTSSWLQTPSEIRSLGGALFGDRRYDHVFTYHNGADSYYKVRAFRSYVHL